MNRHRELLEARPCYWEDQDDLKPNKFGVFAHTTQHIVLGFPKSLEDYQSMPVRSAEWNNWEDVINPVISKVVEYYNYDRGRVNRIMFAKLLPGKKIEKHIDHRNSSSIPHKIHVPLVTN